MATMPTMALQSFRFSRLNMRISTTFWFAFVLILGTCHALSQPQSPNTRRLAPELDASHIEQVTRWVQQAIGDDNDSTKATDERYSQVRQFSSELASDSIPEYQLVYGELSIPVLATLLDAVGVREGDVFLDIGSGDGALVLGASLLYPEHIHKSWGLELVPKLVERSQHHADTLLHNMLPPSAICFDTDMIEFAVGDVHESNSNPAVSSILSDTTLAICFATTWCRDSSSRLLPRLSRALLQLPKHARIIVVDGRLDPTKDAYRWEGDLKIHCPDTAPYSVASLYTRT